MDLGRQCLQIEREIGDAHEKSRREAWDGRTRCERAMSRIREGWEYEVLVIRPDGTQQKMTRLVLYNTKHVAHREAMQVMRAQKNVRAPGCVVRMLRSPWGTKVADAWSDDGNTWRPILNDSETFNATIEAVREREKSAVERTILPSGRPKKRCLTLEVPPIQAAPGTRMEVEPFSVALPADSEKARECCVCTGALSGDEGQDACTSCRNRFGPHLIMAHMAFTKLKAEQGEYAIEMGGYVRVKFRSCRLTEGDAITLYGVESARAGQMSVFLPQILSVVSVSVAEHNARVRDRNSARKLRKRMQGVGDGHCR